jgi:hypothetical protein
MNQPEGNEYADVLEILSRSYRALLAQLAEEIREKSDDFDNPLFGGPEGLLEKYAWPINHFSSVYGALRAEGEALFQKKVVCLADGQFLCFSCRAVISKSDTNCPKCGWSWRGQESGRWLPSEQRMTERAQRVLSLAGDHARRLRAARVEVEHLLLALAQEEQGTAARALAEMGIDYATLEGRITAAGPQVGAALERRHVPLGDVAEQVMADAWGECRQLEAGQLGTGHLLLAMTRLLGEPAARVVRLLQADLAVVRRQVVTLLQVDSGQ